MKKSLSRLGVALLVIPRIAFPEQTGPNWNLQSLEAEWRSRDSQGELVFQDNLWILGGWFAADAPNPRDVWRSPDGKNWIQVCEKAPWMHSDLSAAMVFKDRIWFMGGRKLPGAENSNSVWSSRDGSTWNLETKSAGWSPRVGMSFAVFKDRMWILGGTENFYDDNDETLKNDVWSSSDGKEWKLEIENALWSKRTHAQAIVFDDKIWILGGGRWHPETVPRNDVWCSEDGVSWTEVTASAPWEPRLWFSTVVYRDRMWVLGGWSKAHGNFGDVWYTEDGERWTELQSEVVWKKRHEHSALVFQDKIWVMGGHAEPLNSEVWSLHIPEDWFDRP